MIRLCKELNLWVVLALPAGPIWVHLLPGRMFAMKLLHPSGEISVRLVMLDRLPGAATCGLSLNRFRTSGGAGSRHRTLYEQFGAAPISTLPNGRPLVGSNIQLQFKLSDEDCALRPRKPNCAFARRCHVGQRLFAATLRIKVLEMATTR